MHARLAMVSTQFRATDTTKQCMQLGPVISVQLVFQQMNTTTKGIGQCITELVVAYRQAVGEDPTGLAAEIERLSLENAAEQPHFHRFADIAWEDDEEGANQEDDASTNEGAEEERPSLNEPEPGNASETVASTSTAGDNEGYPQRKQNKAEVRAAKKAFKAERSWAKAAKNQRRQSVPVRSEDIEAVERVLHGEHAAEAAASHPLATDKTVEDVINRNRSFVASIEAHKKQLLFSIARKRRTGRERQRSSGNCVKGKRRKSELSEEKEADMDDLVTAVLANLGIDPAHIGHCGPGSGPKKGNKGAGGDTGASAAAIIANLKKEIKEDLRTFEHEQREVCIRAGGFWRYVGSKVFERMTKIAQEVDWKTGRKLKE
ncbi:hypothetical protein PV08_01568 [Exophiala spinifera]|uniref:Uncharacterized protein n=1 Tax=Exophiala spinifera TaxID=91928 RepID=A0A0D2CBV9_9EURO|nr:uncharacterized protein PV08_01568 [Exophiala spinifera]KIW20989.1 hypothetical protein PV08_01568 [Exophiala spinifera]